MPPKKSTELAADPREAIDVREGTAAGFIRDLSAVAEPLAMNLCNVPLFELLKNLPSLLNTPGER